MNETFEILKANTATQREAFVARAEEQSIQGLKMMRSRLADVGMDLTKVAPRPNSWKMGKREYRQAMNLRNRYLYAFKPVPLKDPHPVYQMTAIAIRDLPEVVAEKPDAEPYIRGCAKRDANALFDAFLLKMAGKIGPACTAARLDGIIWDGCTVTATLADGSSQVWTTKCILNQSIYGKLFNQWPTRRVS
jgi:hypothetical protein